MQRKSVWFVLSAGIIIMVLFHARPAMATDPVGFTSTTIAKGQFAEINALSEFRQPNPPHLWRSRQRTRGLSDGYVLNNVWDPGGSTGWHTHLSHTLIFVVAGTVTQYEGDDPSCTPTVYTAGMAFVDAGGTHVHIVRNEGSVQAQVIAVRLIPTGQPGRIDAPDPGNCHF
jgi:uncharacterized cupin superfamily protein